MSFREYFNESIEKNSSTILYHVTKASNLESILKNGLQPRLVQVPGIRTKTPRIYLFSNINAENIDMIELFQHKIESLGTMMSKLKTTPPDQYEDVVVIKVTLPKLFKVYPDPQVHARATNAYFVSNKTIDPEYLEVVYKGPIHSKEKQNLKSFVKQYGIEGAPYRTDIVIDFKQTKQFYSKIKQLQKQANNTLVDYKSITPCITLYTLKNLKSLKFWHNAVTKENEPFETDYFFDLFNQIYEDKEGHMIFGVSREETSYKDYYSLGVAQNEFEQILTKELNCKIATSESEMKEVYNELMKEQGREDLTL